MNHLPVTVADIAGLSPWAIVSLIIVAVLVALAISNREKIKRFSGEVRTELVKASWPWDLKERGFKRYKELTDSTLVVVVAMLLLAGYISFCDLCLTSIIGALTK
ncbi:MAG TPA: preprotein translocase subunit SecE [Chthoniobacteraceae bacterium]|jgi:preprotein translocase subunit SecE|nr:preprotein translocase subunit SecE [Chthoniobacteraceae bacterium]